MNISFKNLIDSHFLALLLSPIAAAAVGLVGIAPFIDPSTRLLLLLVVSAYATFIPAFITLRLPRTNRDWLEPIIPFSFVYLLYYPLRTLFFFLFPEINDGLVFPSLYPFSIDLFINTTILFTSAWIFLFVSYYWVKGTGDLKRLHNLWSSLRPHGLVWKTNSIFIIGAISVIWLYFNGQFSAWIEGPEQTNKLHGVVFYLSQFPFYAMTLALAFRTKHYDFPKPLKWLFVLSVFSYSFLTGSKLLLTSFFIILVYTHHYIVRRLSGPALLCLTIVFCTVLFPGVHLYRESFPPALELRQLHDLQENVGVFFNAFLPQEEALIRQSEIILQRPLNDQEIQRAHAVSETIPIARQRQSTIELLENSIAAIKNAPLAPDEHARLERILVPPNNSFSIFSPSEVLFEKELKRIRDNSKFQFARLFMNRFIGADSLAAAIQTTPETVGFQHGATYGLIPAAIIPSMFWHNKPNPSLCGWFARHYKGDPVGSATCTATTVFAEGYINAGTFGILIIAVIYGLMLGFVAMSCLHPQKIVPTALTLFLFLFIRLLKFEDNMASIIGGLVKHGIVLTAIFAFLCTDKALFSLVKRVKTLFSR